MTKQIKTRVVFSMKYAMEMIARGHKVVATTPNPRKPEFDMWIFELDETFDAELEEITGCRRKE